MATGSTTFSVSNALVSNASFVMPTTGTYSCWYYPFANTPSATIRMITHIRATASGPESWGWQMLSYSDSLWYAGWLSPSSTSYRYTSSTPTLTANTWHHLCMTWASGGNVYLRIDDAATGSPGYCATSVGTTANPLIIGNNFSGIYSANGRIADVAYWNRVLTAGEITALAAKHAAATVVTPMAYWPLAADYNDKYGNYNLSASNMPASPWDDGPGIFYPLPVLLAGEEF